MERFHGRVDFKIFLMFKLAENTGSVNIMVRLVYATVKTLLTIKLHLSHTLKRKGKKQLYTISQLYSEISVHSTTKHPYTEIFTIVL